MAARPKSDNEVLADVFKRGQRYERAKQRKKRTKAKKGPGAATKAAHRAKRPVSTGTRRALREVERPIVEGVTGTVKVSVLLFGVIALYTFLNSATHVAGALGSISRSLDWLRAPDKPIPYVQKG